MDQKKRRGFAGMDEAKQREIASKGGKAAHQKGTAHRFTPEEARAAGRKGGQIAHTRGTAHEFTPEEARAAGRKGGKVVRERRTLSTAAVSKEPAAYEPGLPEPVASGVTAPGSFGPKEGLGSLPEDRERFATTAPRVAENG